MRIRVSPKFFENVVEVESSTGCPIYLAVPSSFLFREANDRNVGWVADADIVTVQQLLGHSSNWRDLLPSLAERGFGEESDYGILAKKPKDKTHSDQFGGASNLGVLGTGEEERICLL